MTTVLREFGRSGRSGAESDDDVAGNPGKIVVLGEGMVTEDAEAGKELPVPGAAASADPG